MRSLKALLLLTLIFNFPVKSVAQVAGDNITISLLTCGPGDELYSVFGHTAIRVKNTDFGYDAVYNYGTFDFDTPNFYLKFIKGDLQYFVSVSAYEDFIYTYRSYDRDVYEQELNLTAYEKKYIADDLNKSLSPDNRYYTYKFIDRNCTTMAADIISKHMEGAIAMKNDDSGKTNREIIYDYLDNKFYENLGINLIFGYTTDVPMYKLFLPKQLLQGISHTKMENGAPLAASVKTVYKSSGTPGNPSWWNNYYTYALICLILMFGCKYALIRRSLLALFGLAGIFFCFVGFYSYHNEITENYNALLISPLFLVLLFLDFANAYKAVKIVGILNIILIIVYIFILFNKPHLMMMIPLIGVSTVVTLSTLWLPTRKKLYVD